MAERAPGRLDLLRSTPIAARDIVKGKLLAVIFGGLSLLSWTAIFSLISSLALTLLAVDRVPVVIFCLGLPAAEVVLAFLAAGIGLLAASLLRRTVPALVLAYALVLGILLGLPYVLEASGLAAGPFVVAGLGIVPAAAVHLLAVRAFDGRWMRDRGD
jgi:hypothetical protein